MASRLMRYGPIALASLIALIFMVNESLLATVIILADGALAVVIWIAAIGLGWWTIALLRPPAMPLRWQLVLAAGIGIGLLGLLVLGLGVLGVLGRVAWSVILGVLVLACVIRAGVYVRRARPEDLSGPWIEWRVAHLLLLPAAAFLVIALMASTIPPGLSWGDEAGGYDVLEYHFGGPKEFWLAGRIVDLPHNVYTYLPFNAEMLYLLAFVIKGDPFEGVYLAQLLNASLAVWAVVAAWLAGRELGRTPGIVAGVVAATCPWLTYLSGVAYVENGLLFVGMLSMAALVRIWRNEDCRHGTWFLLAGLLAGLACGFKYTAVPMVALPIGLLAAWCGWAIRPRVGLGPALFVAGVALTFCPWLARNARLAGNPVFPLAHATLGYDEALWNQTLADRWDRAHAPQPDETGLSGRMARLWQRVLADANYGAGIFVAAALGLLALVGQRRGLVLACLIVLIVQGVTWTAATHLFARFGVPMIIPLVVLAAASWPVPPADRWVAERRIGVILVLVVGAAVNLVHVGGLYYHHTREPDGSPRGWFGAAHVLAQVDPINQYTPDRDTTVWMVGEARAFYVARPCRYHVVFSRDPLAEFARTQPTGRQLLDWFRQRGVTHVYVNWSEIDRFRRPGNYGWDEAVNESLFASMRSAGAKLTHAERDARTGRALYEILEVPVQ